MKLPNSVYDKLKWIVLILLPALSVAYTRLAPVWELPYADKISETLAVIAFFIGSLIGVSTINYNKENQIEMDQSTFD